jgi:prophage DNA circulation protein
MQPTAASSTQALAAFASQHACAYASKYIWWKTPQEAAQWPERVIAQVMNIGDYSDVQTLIAQVGEDVLRKVLVHAQAGQFSARSWTYWHYRLGLCEVDQIPALPQRKFT